MSIFSFFERAPRNRPRPFDRLLDGNRGKPRVLVYTEHLNATYVISFEIPMTRMHARGEVNFAVVDKRNVVVSERLVTEGIPHYWEYWERQFRPSMVVLTRWGLPHAKEILEYHKSRKIPVAFHIDDNLMDLPPSLGTDVLTRQGSEEVIAARVHLLEHCDLIYASTPHLAAILRARFPQQRVFHGMYASYLGDTLTGIERKQHDRTVIGYMGSRGHQEDLALAVPALERLLEERDDIRFEVYGTIKMPSELERFGDRVGSIDVTKSYPDFVVKLAGLGWDIGLAPLVDEAFNHCKAPTKFIEYSSCGIPVIASDVSVYRDVIAPGCGLLVGDDWHGAIARMLDDPSLRDEMLRNARAHCAATFPVERLESQLREMFALLGARR